MFVSMMIMRNPSRTLVQMLASTARPSQPNQPPTWRPSLDDVERISWGKPAKKKGTGSRGVPHRLNDDERSSYDIARRKGFLEVVGSGWRKERRGTPLLNTYRLWCDASAVPAIIVQKSSDGSEDIVTLDLSPLRMTSMPIVAAFQPIVDECIAAIADDGTFESTFFSALDSSMSCGGGDDVTNDAAGDEGRQTNDLIVSIDNDVDGALTVSPFMTEPIFRLPEITVVWVRPRSESKKLAKRISEHFGFKAPTGKNSNKGRTKSRGAPSVRAGKSRRHGGYGIG